MPGTAKSVRKTWVERHRIQHTHTENVVAGPSTSDMSSINVDSLTIDELIEFISSSGSDGIDKIYLRRAIELANEANWVERQKDVLTACIRKLLHGKDPKEQQVRCLRRLVFGLGDALLIAKTGFGKSIIFHAYSILTGKVTIQLVPLSKLGEEQADQVNTYGVAGTKACLVSHETKQKNPALVSEIRRCEYTHIVTSPEQIAMDWFLDLVRDVDFRDRIGLVAIDECHLVSTWASFREAYAQVFTLRANLLPSVIWFGCTATLTREQEAEVIKFGGFRREGRMPGDLEVVRTSIDRPDISLHFLPIPPKKNASLQCLH
jgi:superfamily II DNA helicase RecQ